MRTGRVIVVGAGVGGLVAAGALAARGLAVTVLERAQTVGGKLRQVRAGGAALDAGPTVLTLRPVLEEAFRRAGAELSDHVRLTPAEVLARHYWPDGGRLDLFADPARSVEAVAAFAGRAEAERYRRFQADARAAFEALYAPFMRQPAPSFPGLLWRAGLPRLSRIDPYRSLWSSLGRRFADPRLRQLFARYATYVGASPFDAPATLMLVAHVEQAGVWLVEGGMIRLTEALRAVAEHGGARVRCDAEVAAIRVGAGGAEGVTLAGGERLDADAVVCNADLAALAQGRLGAQAARAASPAGARSLSAATFALRATAEGAPLSRHTVFFSPDYRAEFADLAAGRLPRDPTVYVCAQDRDARAGEAAPPDGAERLFCLVNAPAAGDRPRLDASEIRSCEQRLLARLENSGLRLRPEAATITTPRQFHRLFPGTGGALYGPATRGWTSAFRRPGVRSRIPGLYLAGGGAHPGPGVPMAALSGLMAAEALLADRTSPARSRRTATAGGTSTRSTPRAAPA